MFYVAPCLQRLRWSTQRWHACYGGVWERKEIYGKWVEIFDSLPPSEEVPTLGRIHYTRRIGRFSWHSIMLQKQNVNTLFTSKNLDLELVVLSTRSNTDNHSLGVGTSLEAPCFGGVVAQSLGQRRHEKRRFKSFVDEGR
jgi:hypothetical protein